MSVINLIFGTLASILLAILLNEVRNRTFKRTVQTVTYLPHFLSMVIVVGMAQNMFVSDGPINQMLLSLKLIDQPVWWLGEGKYFWFLVGLINIWKEVGWNSIIYISTMTSIDPTLYEAASIDGAGRFRRILHVTLPGIKSTFMVLLIMNIGHLMEAGFEIQYLLGNDLTIDFSQTIDVFVMKYGISGGNYGRAIASGMFKSVVGIILLIGANFVAKKLDEDTLL
jgi:putative aldouronate transport system permease protein